MFRGRADEDPPAAVADVMLLAWPPVVDGLLRELGTLQDRRVLDFGCGCGHFARRLDHLGARVVGIDSSPAMIEAARSQSLSRIEFRVGSTDAVAPHERFDAITLVLVTPFVEDLRLAFPPLVRAMTPGGVLFLVTYNAGYVRGMLREGLHFRNFDSNDVPRRGTLDVSPNHAMPVYIRYPEEYAYAAEEQGLRLVLEARPPCTPDFLARFPQHAATSAPKFLVLGFRNNGGAPG